jgi:hypothetical protein
MLVRLDQGVLIAVGGGERDEAAPKAQRARNPAHHHDRGAAGRRPTRDTAPADLARAHSGYRVATETPGLSPEERGRMRGLTYARRSHPPSRPRATGSRCARRSP